MARRGLVLLGAMLLAPLGAQAQWKASVFSGLASVSSGLDEVPGPGDSTTTESSMLIAPIRPSFARETARSTFALGYRPEVEYLRGADRQIEWNHYLDIAYRRALGKRTKLEAAYSFVKNSDPVRLFTDNIFVMPRSNFRELATTVSLGHEIARRTTIGIRFDNTLTRIDTSDPDETTFLKQSGFAGTASASYHFSVHQKVTGSYSALKFSPYEFADSGDVTRSLSNVPTVRAGISRFAFQLALAAARSSTTPSGMAAGARIGSPAGTDGVLPTASAESGSPAVADSSLPATARPPATAPAPPAADPLSTTTPAPPPPAPSPEPGGASGGGLPSPGTLVGVVTPPPTPAKKSRCKGKKTDKDCPANSNATAASGGGAGFVSTVAAAKPVPFATVNADGTVRTLGDPFHVLSLTYSYTRGTEFLFEITGGAMRDRNMSYIFGTQIERRFNVFWIGADFEHFLSHYGTMPASAGFPAAALSLTAGAGARSAFNAVTFRAGGNITRALEFQLSGSLSQSNANFVEHDVQARIARARLTYWLTDRLGLSATGDTFVEDRHDPDTTAFSRTRYYAGIQIHISPPPRRAERLPREELDRTR